MSESRKKLIKDLEQLQEEIRWLNYRKVERIEEYIGGVPRYETYGEPSSQGMRRAAVIARAISMIRNRVP